MCMEEMTMTHFQTKTANGENDKVMNEIFFSNWEAEVADLKKKKKGENDTVTNEIFFRIEAEVANLKKKKHTKDPLLSEWSVE